MTKFHREITFGGKKFHQCTKCKYESHKKSNVLTHIQTHINKKPFKCSYSHCKFSTNQKGNLKIHKMTHTGEKPFKCSLCNYSSNRKDSVLRHTSIKHSSTQRLDDTPYLCKYCPFNARRPYHLKLHIKKYHSKIKFMCSQCNYPAKNKALLEKHLYHYHPEIDWKSYIYCPIQKTDILQQFISTPIETKNSPYLYDLNSYTGIERLLYTYESIKLPYIEPLLVI